MMRRYTAYPTTLHFKITAAIVQQIFMLLRHVGLVNFTFDL